MNRSEESHVLALEVRHSRIGYALFSGPRRLLDWGINTVPSQCSNRSRWIRQRIALFLRYGSPACIVMKPHRRAKLPGNVSGPPILKAVQSVAEEQGIPLYVLGRDETQYAFRIFKARTKEEIASAIVGIFPELLVRLPRKRTTYQPEAHGMIVFDAIATGLAYWQRVPPRK
jgi:hypothetical protein